MLGYNQINAGVKEELDYERQLAGEEGLDMAGGGGCHYAVMVNLHRGGGSRDALAAWLSFQLKGDAEVLRLSSNTSLAVLDCQ